MITAPVSRTVRVPAEDILEGDRVVEAGVSWVALRDSTLEAQVLDSSETHIGMPVRYADGTIGYRTYEHGVELKLDLSGGDS